MLYISYAYERTTLSCCASEKLCQDLNADYAGRLFPSAMDNLAGSIMLYSGVYIVGIEEDVCINKNLIAHASRQEMPGVEMIELSIQVDHIHTVMIIPPRYAVSDVVGRIKGRTSSMLRKKFPWLAKVYWKENLVWSPGYFVATVGIDEDKILASVKWQQVQDSGQVGIYKIFLKNICFALNSYD